MNDAAKWICTNLQIRQWAWRACAMSSGYHSGYFWAPRLSFSSFSNLQKAMAAMVLMKVSGLWLSKSELLASFWPCESVKPRKTIKPWCARLKGRWPRCPRSRPRASSWKTMIRRLHVVKCCPVLAFKFFSSLYVLHWHVSYVGLPVLKGVIMIVKKTAGNRT